MVESLTERDQKWMQFQQSHSIWSLLECRCAAIHTFPSLSWRDALWACGSLLAKIIRTHLQAWSCINARRPPVLPQYNVFPFLCVFWSFSCGQLVLRWGAGSSGAPVLFLAAAAVGGCWGGEETEGGYHEAQNQRLFKGFLSGGIVF